LEARVPRCDGHVSRIVRKGEPLTGEDRCRICGGCHVLFIEKVVVERGPDGQLVPVGSVVGKDQP